MKILVVCSYNRNGLSSFVKEQVDSLKEIDINIDYYKITDRGLLGYLKNLIPLRRKIYSGEYDLIHAHYGFSGLLANLQRLVPVVTTYHGSDVHYSFNRLLSFVASKLSIYNILTNAKQAKQLRLQKGYTVVPCGIDTEIFYPRNKFKCRDKLSLSRMVI